MYPDFINLYSAYVIEYEMEFPSHLFNGSFL